MSLDNIAASIKEEVTIPVSVLFLTLCGRFLPPNCLARSYRSKAARAQPLWLDQTKDQTDPVAPLAVHHRRLQLLILKL